MTHDILETIVRTHQAMVYRYLRYMGAAADVAEDVAQETFLAAYRSGSAPIEDAATEGGRCAAWLRGAFHVLSLLTPYLATDQRAHLQRLVERYQPGD